MSTANDPMAEIRASFFIECEELLEALQDGLQLVEDGSDDAEKINVVFRAVHSIKGGAGAFGLEALVRFAHRFETVLEEVRSGRMHIDPDILKLFFKAADHLADHVRACRDAQTLAPEVTAALGGQLDALLGDDGQIDPDVEEVIDFQPMGLSLDLGFDMDLDSQPPISEIEHLPHDPDQPCYIIAFTPFSELFETGNEPHLLLKNLANLGEARIRVDHIKIPELSILAPDVPYMSWNVQLFTNADIAEIASVFEFVEGLC